MFSIQEDVAVVVDAWELDAAFIASARTDVPTLLKMIGVALTGLEYYSYNQGGYKSTARLALEEIDRLADGGGEK